MAWKAKAKPHARRAGSGCLLAIVFSLVSFNQASADQWGWNYLIEKLVADGVDRQRAVAVFDDDRVPSFSGLEFGTETAREPRSLYRRFLRASTVAAARRCRASHAEAFEKASERYGVSADAVAAIFFVESSCGGNTGSTRVFYRLARLAMANEPQNLQRNLDRYADGDGRLDPVIESKLRGRALYLEETFYPEVRAMFQVADRMRVDPLEIRGSGSGAFGYPQFLPSSYLAYGVDADGDGRVSLYDVDDAAASCAHYLSSYGWQRDASAAQRRAAVWQYNHSQAYVDAVLQLAAQIGKKNGPLVTQSKRRTVHGHAATKASAKHKRQQPHHTQPSSHSKTRASSQR